MNKRRYLIISISILFLVILINTPTLNAQINQRAWRVGTSVTYSYEGFEKWSRVMTNDTPTEEREYTMEAKLRINITEIDEINEGVTVLESIAGYSPQEFTLNFNASVCSFNMANNLFYFHYYWDSNLNKVLLSSFAIYHYSFLYFIHPDWEAFNKNLVKALDGDIVIDTVDTGTGTRNVFLSDFLSEVSFVINGQNTIEAARNSFTADKSRWKFQFDLSEYILDRDYDYLTDTYEYFGYDRYEETFELEFSKGGILSKMSTGTIYTITKENIRTSYETQLSMKVGDSSTATINFSVLPVIIVLILLPIILPFKRKKN